ncbi:Os02g0534550 [Oryza sativa Japonica Group]|uniref:Os02g0534550 protein n=1 Tax=Oryza sativa subsp. japonica TaxID=39947 RepID=A0A0P0VJX0_ORYSJ|nr:Os02g0534550 [Oryza sativa Japonica Group]
MRTTGLAPCPAGLKTRKKTAVFSSRPAEASTHSPNTTPPLTSAPFAPHSLSASSPNAGSNASAFSSPDTSKLTSTNLVGSEARDLEMFPGLHHLVKDADRFAPQRLQLLDWPLQKLLPARDCKIVTMIYMDAGPALRLVVGDAVGLVSPPKQDAAVLHRVEEGL